MESDVKSLILPFNLGGVELSGDLEDDYFKGADVQIEALAPLAALVRRRIACDARVLDVGANIGLSALILSRCCPQGQVIAFEPSPRNLVHLRRNLERNGAKNVQVVASAVGHAVGELRFFESPFGAGSHVTPAGFGASVETVTVPVHTIDSATFGGKSVSFIKMDVEGYEPQAIAGAAQLLQRDRPLIFMEWNSWALGGIAGVSLPAFARALWNTFDIWRTDLNGELWPAEEDHHSFLFRNILHNNCMEDLVMRPREGIVIPSVEQMTLPSAVATELEARRLQPLSDGRLVQPPSDDRLAALWNATLASEKRRW